MQISMVPAINKIYLNISIPTTENKTAINQLSVLPVKLDLQKVCTIDRANKLN